MEWYVELINTFIDRHVTIPQQEEARSGVNLILQVLSDILKRMAPVDFKALANAADYTGHSLSVKQCGEIIGLISDFHQAILTLTSEMHQEILMNSALDINEVYRHAEKHVSDSGAVCQDIEDCAIPLSDTESYPSDYDTNEDIDASEENPIPDCVEPICAALKTRLTAMALPEPSVYLGSSIKLAEIFGCLNHLPAPPIARRLVILQEQLPRTMSGLYEKLKPLMRLQSHGLTHDDSTQFQLAFMHLLIQLEAATREEAKSALPHATKRLAQHLKLNDAPALKILATALENELMYFKRQLFQRKTNPSFTQILACCNELECMMGGNRAVDLPLAALNTHYEAHPSWKNHRLQAKHFLRIFLAILILQLKQDDYGILCFEMADKRLDFLRSPYEASTVDMLIALEKGALRLFNYQLEPKINALKAWYAANPPSDAARQSLMTFCSDDSHLHASIHRLLFEADASSSSARGSVDARQPAVPSHSDETMLQGTHDAHSSPAH